MAAQERKEFLQHGLQKLLKCIINGVILHQPANVPSFIAAYLEDELDVRILLQNPDYRLPMVDYKNVPEVVVTSSYGKDKRPCAAAAYSEEEALVNQWKQSQWNEVINPEVFVGEAKCVDAVDEIFENIHLDKVLGSWQSRACSFTEETLPATNVVQPRLSLPLAFGRHSVHQARANSVDYIIQTPSQLSESDEAVIIADAIHANKVLDERELAEAVAAKRAAKHPQMHIEECKSTDSLFIQTPTSNNDGNCKLEEVFDGPDQSSRLHLPDDIPYVTTPDFATVSYLYETSEYIVTDQVTKPQNDSNRLIEKGTPITSNNEQTNTVQEESLDEQLTKLRASQINVTINDNESDYTELENLLRTYIRYPGTCKETGTCDKTQDGSKFNRTTQWEEVSECKSYVAILELRQRHRNSSTLSLFDPTRGKKQSIQLTQAKIFLDPQELIDGVKAPIPPTTRRTFGGEQIQEQLKWLESKEKRLPTSMPEILNAENMSFIRVSQQMEHNEQQEKNSRKKNKSP